MYFYFVKYLSFILISIFVITSCQENVSDEGRTGLADLEAELKSDSVGFKNWNSLASIYDSTGSYDKAIKAYSSSIQRDSNQYHVLMILADFYLKNSSLHRTDQLLRKAIEVDSTATEPRLKLAQLSIYFANYNQAFSYINSALKINVNIPQAYFMKGVCYKHLKDSTKTLSSYRTAVELNPNYFEAYIELGLISTLLKDSIGIQYYKNALEINSNSLEAMNGLAWSYQEFNRANESKKLYKMILANEGGNDIAKFNLAVIYLNEFEADSAIQLFEELELIEEVRKDVQFNLSQCYLIKGDKERSAEYLSLSKE